MKKPKQSLAGKYVALDPADASKFIAVGTRSDAVARRARRAGVEVPIIIYVPKVKSNLY